MWWLDKGCTAQGLEGKVGSALCLGPPQKEAFTWDTVAAGRLGKRLGWLHRAAFSKPRGRLSVSIPRCNSWGREVWLWYKEEGSVSLLCRYTRAGSSCQGEAWRPISSPLLLPVLLALVCCPQPFSALQPWR